MNAFFVICGIGVFSLLAEVFNLKKWVTVVSFAGLILAVGVLIKDWSAISYYYHGMLFFDRFAIAFTCLILVISIFWYWMSGDFFKGEAHRTDKSALVFFVIAGAIMMVAFNNMAVLFLGIEILSVSLYVLAGSDKENLFSTEAAFKYFLMGSFATGFLLFGMTLVYGVTGSFNIPAIANFITTHPIPLRIFYVGILMMMVGLAFKISAVPFHTWAPDVYEGSPTPITALMSTVVKIGAFAAFVKIFSVCFGHFDYSLVYFEQGIMILTLVVANITAVYQANVKRMLAYSSVGQIGYLLLAFSSDNMHSSGIIFYYLTAYTVASILAFTVVQIIETNKGSANIVNFQGLLKSNPLMAIAMTVAMLSLAGIPPMAGFFGKYLVFTLSVSKGFVAFTVVAVVTSLIGVYYYFKPIVAIYQSSGQPILISKSQKALLIILIFLNLLAGLAPDLVRLF
ncbi:MAG TPA: NADH-quinone oxidoreductase subunit N [Cyclobacteriaceae bacterium]|jgi:NADH-quinone oxidoreductase subunit N|nr:NADH-quinone oxidoreductase subunit N [Cyclobacteriaceae bacterium]